MNYIVSILTILIILVFLLTATDKLLNWKKHISTINSYKIVKGAKINFILVIMTLSEFYISISLVLSGATLANTIVFLSIISIYTAAIVINLTRGNVEISCGCGSILESNRLTYRLVLRNLIFAIVFIFMFLNKEYKINQLLLFEIISMLLLSVCILILGSIMKEVKIGHIILNKISKINKMEEK